MHFLDRIEVSWDTHLDYGWFLALLAWTAAIWAWSSRKDWGAASAWLVAFGLCNLAVPVLEMWPNVQAALFGDREDDFGSLAIWRLSQDILLAAMPALAAVALIGAVAMRRQLSLVRILIGGGLLLLAGFHLSMLRWDHPIAGSAALSALVVAAAWVAALSPLRDHARKAWPLGMALWASQQLTCTTGIWANSLEVARRNLEFTPFDLPAQLHALASAVVLAVMAWRVRTHRGRADSAWPAVRQLSWLLAVGLAGGFGLMQLSGRLARVGFEDNLLRQANLITAFLDRRAIGEALGPGLQLTEIKTRRRNKTGNLLTYCRVPLLAGEAYTRLRTQLSLAADANLELWDVSLLVERGDWLGVVVKWPDYPAYFTEMLLTPIHEDWRTQTSENPAGFVVGPVREPWRNVLHVSVPVFDERQQQRLGWLDIEVTTREWARSFNLARLQSMAMILVGVALWVVVVGLRLRAFRQARAEAAAQTARSADEAKSRFLAHVSHELRTPLQGMLGHAELLARAPLAQSERTHLESLLSQGAVLKRLVNDLIDLGALDAGAFRLVPVAFNPAALAFECLDAIRPLAEAKRIQLSFVDHTAAASAGAADAVRVRQVLLNLLGNAVKFTPVGGRVQLELRARPAAGSTNGAGLRFIVRDTGPGIPDSSRRRIFRAFGCLGHQPEQEGAGLGLAVSAALARAMGGDLALLEGSSGAEFALDLPLASEGGPAAVQPRRATTATDWARLRLLVVDDNAVVRAWLQELLRSTGASVVLAVDGAEAMQAAQANDFDVVVLDISLPGIDGWAVAREIGRRRTARIIGLSAHASAADAVRARDAGFAAFLAKPVESEVLLESIAAAIRLAQPSAPTSRERLLNRRLEELYVEEVVRDVAGLRAALAGQDRPRLAFVAHHLKNSADIMQQQTLAAACARLQQSAETASPQELTRQVIEIEALTKTVSGSAAGPE